MQVAGELVTLFESCYDDVVNAVEGVIHTGVELVTLFNS